ncbi:hypothetical protein SCYAM73S_04043 [Streptomyces cyaneofuscatus]
MTGAPLPAGAEAVVPVEWTDGGTGEGPAATMRAHSDAPEGATGEVRVHRSVEAGAHVRERGSDVKPGDLALRAGSIVGPPQIGLLAAIGRSTVVVRPRPRVVVLSMLTLAAFFALGGRLSDIAGYRRVMLIGTLVFVISSAMCGAVPAGDFAQAWLIGFRAVQGIGAALMFLAALAVVIAVFPVGRRGRCWRCSSG